MRQVLGFELKIGDSGFWAQLEFLGFAAHFRFESGVRRADLSLSPDRTAKSIRGALVPKDTNGIFFAHRKAEFHSDVGHGQNGPGSATSVV